MKCACGHPLWAPASIESGQCEHCRLYGPTSGRALPVPEVVDDEQITVDPIEDGDEIGSGVRFKKRRSTAAPLPPGPACTHCGRATHAPKSQRDSDRRPAHLSCLQVAPPRDFDHDEDESEPSAWCGCGNSLRSVEALETGQCRPCRELISSETADESHTCRMSLA